MQEYGYMTESDAEQYNNRVVVGFLCAGILSVFFWAFAQGVTNHG